MEVGEEGEQKDQRGKDLVPRTALPQKSYKKSRFPKAAPGHKYSYQTSLQKPSLEIRMKGARTQVAAARKIWLHYLVPNLLFSIDWVNKKGSFVSLSLATWPLHKLVIKCCLFPSPPSKLFSASLTQARSLVNS